MHTRSLTKRDLLAVLAILIPHLVTLVVLGLMFVCRSRFPNVEMSPLDSRIELAHTTDLLEPPCGLRPSAQLLRR
jgi:hypothetical protein